MQSSVLVGKCEVSVLRVTPHPPHLVATRSVNQHSRCVSRDAITTEVQAYQQQSPKSLSPHPVDTKKGGVDMVLYCTKFHDCTNTQARITAL